jgi:predicted acylesterase/phospholipase RssA
VNSDIKDLSLNEKMQYFIKHPFEYLNNDLNINTPDPKFWRILYQMFIIVQVRINDLSLQISKPDILIEPVTGDFKVFNFSKAKELIEIGYSTAKKQLHNYNYCK